VIYLVIEVFFYIIITKHKLRKNEKRIFFNGNHQKFWEKRMDQIKKSYCFEKTRHQVLSYAFIPISMILTKMDFFLGEGGGEG